MRTLNGLALRSRRTSATGRAALIEVRYQRGLQLPELGLWLDPLDGKPEAFVSHAHADHVARHGVSVCSDVTAGLLQRRFRVPEGKIEATGFHLPWERDGFRLRLLPAGHIAGSAMLHVTRLKDQASLLYTGDFKIRRSRTAEPVGFLTADTLIMETTFGLPMFEFPSPLEVESSLLRFVHDAIADGETPVLCAYALGKAQEVLALLAEHDIPALQHPAVAAMTRACRELGVALPAPVQFEGYAPPGHVVLAPPGVLRTKFLNGLKSKRTAMLTGWAMQAGTKYRYRVDEVIAFSDHADHPGLLECIRRVRPQRVLTVHGFAREFAAELRTRQIDAWCAMGNDQLELSIGKSPSRARAGSASRQSRPICALADFSDLCRLVGETSSRVAKTQFIAGYFRTLESDQDLRLAVQWLTGEALAPGCSVRPLRMVAMGVRHALLSLPGARAERYSELFQISRDPARAARSLLQEIPLKPEPLDLPGLETFFLKLSQTAAPLEQIAQLATRLATLHPAEGETLIKLLGGGAGLGMDTDMIEDALAAAFSVAPAALRHAHMVGGDLSATALLARHARLEEAVLQALVPVRPMLAAAPVEARQDAASGLAMLAFAPPVWLEAECRGVRAQLHKLGDAVAMFSADLRRLAGQYPAILTAAGNLAGDFIVDGVILTDCIPQHGRDGDLFSAHEGRPLPLFPRFVAIDLLWRDGDALIDLPLSVRRLRMDAMMMAPPIEVMERVFADNAAAVDTACERAMRDGHQGLIAKDPDAPYLPGRQDQAWIRVRGAG